MRKSHRWNGLVHESTVNTSQVVILPHWDINQWGPKFKFFKKIGW